MRRSTVTLEWEARAVLRTTRDSLLLILRARFSNQVTPDIDRTVQAQTDLAILHAWINAAATASNIEDVRTALGLNR